MSLFEVKLEEYDEGDIKLILDNSVINNQNGMEPSGPDSELAYDILSAAKDWGYFEAHTRKEAYKVENSAKH